MSRKALFIFGTVISTLLIISVRVAAIPSNTDFQKADARVTEFNGLRHHLADVRISLLEELFSYRFPRLYFRAWKRSNMPQNDEVGSSTESTVIDNNISQMMNDGIERDTLVGISNAQENDIDGGDMGLKVNQELKSSVYQPETAEQEDFPKRALRREIDCDMENITYNMLLHYFKTGKMCGDRTGKIRFGIGG